MRPPRTARRAPAHHLVSKIAAANLDKLLNLGFYLYQRRLLQKIACQNGQTPSTFAHGYPAFAYSAQSPCLMSSAALTCRGVYLQANWSAAVSHENQLLHQHQQLLEQELAAPDRSA